MTLGLVAGALLLSQACTSLPESAGWVEGAPVKRPPTPPAGARPADRSLREGYLLVQSPITANPTASGTSEYEVHEPFSLFDRDGRPVGEFRSRRSHESPLPFPAGLYIVVTRIDGHLRQVQAEVQGGATTVITAEDFRQGFAID
jgi:hypothetical protein